MARFDELAPPAMRRLLAGGTQLRRPSRDILAAATRRARTCTPSGDQNPRFRKVWEHFNKHRVKQSQWFRVAEDSMADSSRGLGPAPLSLPRTGGGPGG